MNPTAYIETSVVSYLTARPSRDVVVAAYQEVTRAWWRDAATRFELVASALVIAEARVGDVDAARARLEALKDVAFLDATLDAEQLTQTQSACRNARASQDNSNGRTVSSMRRWRSQRPSRNTSTSRSQQCSGTVSRAAVHTERNS